MSDTPRTDASVLAGTPITHELVKADFARQLERELREAQAEINRLNRFFMASGHD